MMHLYVILCGVCHLSAVIQSATVKQNTGLVSANVGDNVTLLCFYDSQVAMHFSWYQQTLGSGPELLFTIYKYEKPSNRQLRHWLEKNPRFSVQRTEGTIHLHISDVRFSDSAAYFCASSHSNMVEFGEGVFLSVKEVNLQQVVQRPECETFQPGGSVTLNCTVHTGTCDGEHSVYWFRHGPRQGLLHTHRGQCKHVSTPGSPPQSCVYYLQRMNLSSSDAGTYYCTVVHCGQILFGSGSELLIKDDEEDQTAQMRILVWLSIIRTGTVFFFLMVYLLVYITKSC